MTFRFLHRGLIEQLHSQQLNRHGGGSGLRDEGALESALSRPVNKAMYGCDDVFELAAVYLFGLARNHAFVDGNRRIAIVAAAVFLMGHGYEIETDNASLYLFVLGVADGSIDETGIAAFFRDHCVALKD